METPFTHLTSCSIGTCFDPSSGVTTPYVLAEYEATLPSLLPTLQNFTSFVLEVARKESGAYCFSITGVPQGESLPEIELLILYDATLAGYTKFEEALSESQGSWRLLVASSDVVCILINQKRGILSFDTSSRSDYGLK